MEDKKGQTTIFIIIGIMIVVAGLLIYLFYPRISGIIGIDQKSPSVFMKECLEESIKDSVELLSLRGGVIEPEFYFTYNEEKLRYLCYSAEYYSTCTMQDAFLQGTIQNEINKNIRIQTNQCLDDLKNSFEKRGYTVELKKGNISAEILPKRIVVTLNSPISLTKNQETQNYEKINLVVENNLFELVSISNSILNSEARYGDSETTTYMTYYKDLKVEKLKQFDGTTIYILTDRNTGNKFQFASRSVAWPSGYIQ